MLEASHKAKIIGEGFVWFHVDEYDLRHMIDSSGHLTSFHRRLFAGFLTMSDPKP